MSTTRPLTGEFTRTSCSSLNCTLPVVSSICGRVTYSGFAVFTAASGAGADGSRGFAPALGDPDGPSEQPAQASPITTSAAHRETLRLKGSPDGGLELVDRGPVVAERSELLERGLPIRAL